MKFSVVGILTIAIAGVLAGCDTTPKSARNAILLYDEGDYVGAATTLKPAVDKEEQKASENYVLTHCRYGSCAIAAGNMDEAEHAFYEAYKVINSGDTNDAGRQLQASVVFEGVKVWKGEPFERTMADYYLGVLYLMKHDYGNARAAFQNSLFSLRENASKDDLEHYNVVESRFALGYFGLGFCNLRLNRADLAAQNFALAQKYDPQLTQLIADVQQPGVNGLVFVDWGMGPRKAARGWYNEETVFGPTPSEAGPIPQPVVLLDARPATRQRVAYDTVDTLAMAQDRRWMDIDTIKKVKAVVGTGAMAAGAGMTAAGADRRDKGLFWAGVGTTVLGAALAASSQSDTRYWEMLPRTVDIVPVTLTPGAHEVVVQAGAQRAMVRMSYAQPARNAPPADAIFY
ncbi:MAG TPA: hypothetical protein VGN88_03115, partial [Phycisphaerae bacterium]